MPWYKFAIATLLQNSIWVENIPMHRLLKHCTTFRSNLMTRWANADGAVIFLPVIIIFDQYWPKMASALRSTLWILEIFTPMSKTMQKSHCAPSKSKCKIDWKHFRVPTDLLSVTGNPNATYWNMEAGYTDSQAGESALNSYPNRVLGTGPDNGLNVQLRLNPMELDYLCQGAVQGFKVVLHAPTEIPQPSKNFLRLPLEQEILVSVKPNMVVTTKELRHYPPNRKLCYLNSERSLKFYKVYTQQHCELECVSNYTLKQCGCVFLTHPRNECKIQMHLKILKIIENNHFDSKDRRTHQFVG